MPAPSSLTECLGARRQLAACFGHFARRMVDLPQRAAQRHLHIAHGKQNVSETAHIHILVRRMYIHILIRHLIQQIINIFYDNAQSFHKGCCGSGKHACLVPVGNAGHRRLQIPLHQKLHPVDARLHGTADIAGKRQRNDNGNQYGNPDHCKVNYNSVPCGSKIIDLRSSHRDTPAVRIRHRRIRCKHQILSLRIRSKPVFPVASRCGSPPAPAMTDRSAPPPQYSEP